MGGKAVIMGARGMLGQALLAAAAQRPAWTVQGFDMDQVDIAQRGPVQAVLAREQPQVVFNAAGYTQVDRAELEPAAALSANTTGPGVLAVAAAAVGAVLVHVSTDHVFDGASDVPYPVEAAPRPLNTYALSKLGGEQAVAAHSDQHYIVRTAGLFGPGGKHFVGAILERARRGEHLRVVADQVCQRTASGDLAAALFDLVDTAPTPGIYHFANEGAESWYAFAQRILAAAGLTARCEPVDSRAWAAPARRPAFSVLDVSRWTAAGMCAPRTIAEALADYLDAEPPLADRGE